MGKNREQHKAKRKEKRSSGEVYSQKRIRLKQAQIEAQQERPRSEDGEEWRAAEGQAEGTALVPKHKRKT
jgi:hypothetical protein